MGCRFGCRGRVTVSLRGRFHFGAFRTVYWWDLSHPLPLNADDHVSYAYDCRDRACEDGLTVERRLTMRQAHDELSTLPAGQRRSCHAQRFS